MKLLLIAAFSFLYFSSIAQTDVKKYYDTSLFYRVDSVFFKIQGQKQALFIIYQNSDDESVIVYKNNSKYFVYNHFLPCYSCQGRGDTSSTYAGHCMKGDQVVLIHDYFSGRDSVYLEFSGGFPSVAKIVQRSYNGEPIQSVDDPGDYVFIAKRKGITPISSLQLPADKAEPNIKQLFYIKKIKWIKPNWF